MATRTANIVPPGGASLRRFEEIMSALPQDPITPQIEQDIVQAVREARAVQKSKVRKR